MGESRRDAFEAAVERYITGYLEHMACEEHDIIPAAKRLFTEADWVELDAAFAANKDPLTGHEPEDGYRPLFRKIVNAAPAPIGLG
jgi:hemerythrin-like domain-containing protein